MSALGVTCRRTLSRARSLITTAFGLTGFLAASAVLFAFRLEDAEGTRQMLATVWASSVAPVLPIVPIFLSMDVWSDERRTGRIDFLLSIDVREKDYVLGKTLGVFIVTIASIVLSLGLTLGMLGYYAPETLSGVRAVSFLPALFILVLQAALWSSASCAVSALCTRSFAAACGAAALLVALPRGLWAALLLWAPSGRPVFGEMPLDAHVADFSSGVFSTGVMLFYAAFIVFSLFVSYVAIISLRYRGRRAMKNRFGSLLSIVLALVCAASFAWLAFRFDAILDVPMGRELAFSSRMRHVLSESSGRVAATIFLPRNDPSFRPVSRFLRKLKGQADALGGVELTLRFVDPSWDFGAAERLVRLGAQENALVFEKGHRTTVLPIADALDEGAVASALQRVAMPPQRRDVYWTIGHGESAYDAYGTWGMSDIARELARNGYRNRPLDLSVDHAIPSDCALIVIAGARDAFSRVELGRIDSYLKAGGRVLVLMAPPGESGIAALLPTWGIRPIVESFPDARTLSGSDVIVSEFADHPATAGLDGSRLVFERPLSFVSSAATASGAGADCLDFIPLSRIGSSVVVAAVERGGRAGSDLALRPTRLVAIGDPSFVMNGQLGVRANANRDFFMSVVAYLSGSETAGFEVDPGAMLRFELDRSQRAQFVLVSALGLPFVVFFILAMIVVHRRRRG